jgi:peptide-N4-(N-acetyl-beta-glucosaminyl)asparagine amidase
VGLKRHAVDMREMLVSREEYSSVGAAADEQDAETLAVARAAVAPVPALAAALLANAAEQPFTPFGAEDATVLAGARWFKHTYFRWVDPIKCTSCQGGTQFAGMGEPSAQERARGGGRVELHRCTACGAERRFPRYGEVRALLESREGRCGESECVQR